MKTLHLFNSVPTSATQKTRGWCILPEYGIIVEPSASHLLTKIKKFYSEKALTGNQLNKTFHKSWAKVINSTREDLLVDQIMHYMSTYGAGHTSNFVYTPDEELNVPEVTLNFLVVRGLSNDELTKKCLGMFGSGIAMANETITDVFDVLDNCDYTFTGEEDIKNKEALMFICKERNIVPSDPVEQVRYLYFTATGETLLIKNKDSYEKIKESNTATRRDLNNILKNMDEDTLAEVFNRFKPIFMSFKSILNEAGKKKINRISKLSKELHKPMPTNILNNIGVCTLEELKKQKDNLMNANFFQLARCLNYLKNAESKYKIYSVRNGKAFVKEDETTVRAAKGKIGFLITIIKQKFDLKGKNIFIPADVLYALPTSEKNYLGNVPMGTKFMTEGRIASGIYWENEGGATDLDLSALSVNGKVGWNSSYHGEVTYSGDMTDARNGATEYISADATLKSPHLITNNVFSGLPNGSKFKVIFGKGDDINKAYMMNPNNVWFTADAETLNKQSIVGLIKKEGKNNVAIAVNLTLGGSSVSSNDEKSIMAREALVDKWSNVFYINSLLEKCGANVITEMKADTVVDVDLTPSKLEKDTILKLFV
tara:strand:- start:3133 stop:4926 length:1794 start_codon:yes stop_codon:yes gene_type:complete